MFHLFCIIFYHSSCVPVVVAVVVTVVVTFVVSFVVTVVVAVVVTVVVAVVVTVVVTFVVSFVVTVVVAVVVAVVVVIVELVADVSLVLYNLSLLLFSCLLSQSSSVSVLVFLPSQITSPSHSPVYHMIQHCTFHSLSLPPGSYISSQQPPTSPPLHFLIQNVHVHHSSPVQSSPVHVHSLTCAGLYSEVGMLLEHGHHYHDNTTHADSVMWGGGGMRGDVVRHVVLICNSI